MAKLGTLYYCTTLQRIIYVGHSQILAPRLTNLQNKPSIYNKYNRCCQLQDEGPPMALEAAGWISCI